MPGVRHVLKRSILLDLRIRVMVRLNWIILWVSVGGNIAQVRPVNQVCVV
jgi:hypothetical protein